MNTFSSFEFTAFIGIDLADTKHDICIQPAGSGEREFDRIVHQPRTYRAMGAGSASTLWRARSR